MPPARLRRDRDRTRTRAQPTALWHVTKVPEGRFGADRRTTLGIQEVVFASPLILPPGCSASKNLAWQKKEGRWGWGSSMIVTIGAGVPRNPQPSQ
jgi:hypothetical protein